MSKHKVLTAVSGIGKTNKRLTAGATLDSAEVTKKELEFLIDRGAVEGHTGGTISPPVDEEGDD